ncbi:MAG: hypothetical protein OQK69_03540 [Gammaproteobacteria bacterium]|nr:hypothetical protein [Gammaproteobacteria bacterium]
MEKAKEPEKPNSIFDISLNLLRRSVVGFITLSSIVGLVWYWESNSLLLKTTNVVLIILGVTIVIKHQIKYLDYLFFILLIMLFVISYAH